MGAHGGPGPRAAHQPGVAAAAALRRATRAARVTRWALGAATLAGGALVVRMASNMSVRAQAGGAERLDAGAVVTRGAARVADIQRVVRGRGRGRLPLYLAPARGPVVDSVRVGVLAARLVAGSEAGGAPVVALVSRDSVAGLVLVGRLVFNPGEPGLLVFGDRPGRP